MSYLATNEVARHVLPYYEIHAASGQMVALPPLIGEQRLGEDRSRHPRPLPCSVTNAEPGRSLPMTIPAIPFPPNESVPLTSFLRPKFVMTTKAHVASAHYTILAQTRDELLKPENSPSISMWPYLLKSAQTLAMNSISVYAERGTSREQSRLLYMNAAALRMWREMGKPITIIGEAHRPPRTATLSFGMPFSE